MRNEFIDKLIDLRNNAEPFATAMIVRRTTPSSGKPGDKAIITNDGQIHGWIGGGCTKGIILKEALLAIKERKPRFVTISSAKRKSSFPNTKIYSMSCQSGGEVEAYIEPVLPKPQIVIFGNSHIGMALSKLAKAMDYRIDVVQNKVDKEIYPAADHCCAVADYEIKTKHKNAYTIVCTQGEGDMEALYKAITMESQYLAFVSSRKKAQAVFTDLRNEKGITFDQLKKVKTPAGLDLGAKLPEEVAISILAEIIKQFRSEAETAKENTSQSLEAPNDDYYMNPVCNIPIQKSTAKHILEHAGEKVYFCCDGCKVSFEKEPSKYITA